MVFFVDVYGYMWYVYSVVCVFVFSMHLWFVCVWFVVCMICVWCMFV